MMDANISSAENEHCDCKSLRLVTGGAAGFKELAGDCVCFANAHGGQLLIGIEDDATEPPPDQRVPPELIDRIHRRVGELTVNVDVAGEVHTAENGGEYIVLRISRSKGFASTSDGRFFLRVGDSCQPVIGDDIMRLMDERPAVPWESMTSQRVQRAQADRTRRTRLTAALRASDRVKATVKEKSDEELLEHYGLADGDLLTNLGVLMLGTARDRARLGSAPIIQVIKYDERRDKIAKHTWDDNGLAPDELIDAVWQEVPDFRESYELPDGLFRTHVPAYDEAVVRELLVNALVHRPYTQRGDIYLNLHPDRLEVVNAGRLPLGVTPQNILHASRRRNDTLARLFHDLKRMEREGTGFDLMYDRLLASGRTAPVVTEGTDSVHVTIPRRVIHPGVIKLIADVDQRYNLTQRERIALGILGQTERMLAAELAAAIEIPETSLVRSSWLARLLEIGIVGSTGRTRATRYFVDPALLRSVGLDTQTTLLSIQPHRLRALILEDLERFPDSGRADINRRIGPEIEGKTITRTLNKLIKEGLVEYDGDKRWRKYRLVGHKGQDA